MSTKPLSTLQIYRFTSMIGAMAMPQMTTYNGMMLAPMTMPVFQHAGLPNDILLVDAGSTSWQTHLLKTNPCSHRRGQGAPALLEPI